MNSEAFSHPQRQSVLGVVLIFLTTLYRILRGFWVIGIYLVLKTPSGIMLFYLGMGLAVLAIVVLAYSYMYYRNFIFYINYKTEEFVLEKGVFSTQSVAISFDKIQQVYLKRTLLQRVINVYSVVVDTAGSKEDEVNIDALSGEDANHLSSILIKVKQQNEPVDAEEVIEHQEKKQQEYWTHKLDIPTLLKIGISTNYIRGLALVLTFFTTIYNELNSVFKDYSEEFSEYYEQVPDLQNSVTLLLVLFFILLIISVLITVFEVFIKYFGLKLTQTRDSLELEMGLKTNTKVSLQPRRVQLMQVITNPVQKRFNLYEARVALASSENALQKKKIKIPGLDLSTVGKVKSFLYGDVEVSFEKSFHPHQLMFYRRIFIALLPVLFSLPVIFYTGYISWSLWLILVLLYSVVAITYQWFLYKSLKLIFTDEFLLKKRGVWNKREDNFEIFKMQGVSVNQPLWYKRRNLVNVYFHTAGGDISFKAVTKEILPYINYMLYKEESTNRRWM